MNGKEIVKLAAEFAAGGITADAIKEKYGDGVLTSVLAIAGGIGAGMLTGAALDEIDKYTGVVSDVGGIVDDFLGIFK